MRAALITLGLLLTTCSSVQTSGISVPPGVIDCGISGVTQLAIDLIDDVNVCLGNGRDEYCNLDKPANPADTKCSWKSCLWNLAKTQGKQHSVEALLCAVDQAGIDFRETGMASNDNTSMESALRAEEFVKDSGAKFTHRENGAPPARFIPSKKAPKK
jgi:hypothetical protein